MGMPSGMELFIIVGIIVLLFGGKKIPELAKGIGKGIKDFKSAVKEDEPTTTVATNDKKIEEEKAQATTAKATSTEKTDTTKNTTV